jgi:tripartite-type tricarboxylate transporter receptor subunit TctC
MTTTVQRRRRTLLSAACLMIAALALAPADAPAADFSGETVEWIIPFSEGGGSDSWARFFAPYLSRHLPGEPTVVVRNQPGGGSTTGANMFAQRARPDGLTILGTSGSTQFPYLLDDPRVQYEYADWEVVLATPTGGVAYVDPGLGVSSAADLGKLEGVALKYGSQGATSLDLVPLLAFEIAGLDVQAVMGMQGRGDGRLAFERGEANIDYQTTSAYLANVVPLVEEGKAVPLFSWGALDDDGNLVRDPTFPDLPHFAEAYEMAHGEPPSGTAFEAWKAFFAAGFPVQKMVFLPEGTPEDIVAVYREAFEKAVADPELQANKEQVLGAYKQATGEAAVRQSQLATSVDPEAKAWVRNWLQEKYDVSF